MSPSLQALTFDVKCSLRFSEDNKYRFANSTVHTLSPPFSEIEATIFTASHTSGLRFAGSSTAERCSCTLIFVQVVLIACCCASKRQKQPTFEHLYALSETAMIEREAAKMAASRRSSVSSHASDFSFGSLPTGSSIYHSSPGIHDDPELYAISVRTELSLYTSSS